ncbi:MAG: 1,4-alpha-glucan (glycogen) branching enzyme, GH-13-type [uncultured Nocardioidaceae bacterium]|uniref:1,4-alpha-glucan (Glycogen) branching enzyme, GH-13-type n=1 Tax=uncultured Nocardioidaceae bacterium TaxID=253824 RepID=A0A6J4MB20_9ACTN|nr:MAG: 1,4-alpha-glucan (glycogen) branching enzyme, GH-13-type [uncultured Nocardioidaceae bacterium]
MASKSSKKGSTGPADAPGTPAPATAPAAAAAPAAPTPAAAPDPRPVAAHELQLVAEGRHGNPHAVFGAHPHGAAVTVRAHKPLAESVTVLYADGAETLRAELRH